MSEPTIFTKEGKEAAEARLATDPIWRWFMRYSSAIWDGASRATNFFPWALDRVHTKNPFIGLAAICVVYVVGFAIVTPTYLLVAPLLQILLVVVAVVARVIASGLNLAVSTEAARKPHGSVTETPRPLPGSGSVPKSTDSEIFRKLTELTPDDPRAWFSLGTSYGQQGKYDDAVAAYGHAVKLKPDFADAWLCLGVSYGVQDKCDDAIAAYRQAIKLNPDYAVAWHSLGNSFGKQGKYDEAVTAYDHAIKLKPDYADAWEMLGVTFGLLGKMSEARNALDHLRKLDPSQADKLADFLSSK